MSDKRLQDAVEEVKRLLPLSKVVGRYVELRKAGAELKGICPFHDDKNPSFYVNDQLGLYHCFGCLEGGDILSFLQRHQGIDFIEALEECCHEAGITMPGRDSQEAMAEAVRRGRLLGLLRAAGIHYYKALQLGEGKNEHVSFAREYLRQRGVSGDSIKLFGLGYAPGYGTWLLEILLSQGFTEEEVILAGLAGKDSQGRATDIFRDRIVFPIRNRVPQVISFGGRTIPGTPGDAAGPKYLNGRQSPVFDKRESLFGIHLAESNIRQLKSVVVVEGYLDVIAAFQAGHKNVVSPMGTAITQEHFKLLKRMASRVVLALDGDAAGQEATHHAIDAARVTVGIEQSQFTDVMIAAMPAGKDPDEVIREGLDGFSQAIISAKPIVEFYINRIPTSFDLKNARGKSEAVHWVMPLLGEIRDRIQLVHYFQRLAETVGIEEAEVRREYMTTINGRPRALAPVSRTRDWEFNISQEDRLLAALIRYFQPFLLNNVAGSDERKVTDSDFTYPENRLIFDRLKKLEFEALDGAEIPLRNHFESFPDIILQLERLVSIGKDVEEYRDNTAAVKGLSRRLDITRLYNLNQLQQSLCSQMESLKQLSPEDYDDYFTKLNQLMQQISVYTNS